MFFDMNTQQKSNPALREKGGVKELYALMLVF